jgi:hypothetical protein
MRKFLSILVILVTFSGFQARADEGMWILPLREAQYRNHDRHGTETDS